MFADLVGSTALSERFAPEDLGTILAQYQDCCAGVIAGDDPVIQMEPDQRKRSHSKVM